VALAVTGGKLNYLAYDPALVPPSTFAPTAYAIGRTRAGRSLTLRDFATVRADGESITIGSDGYFGERATVHIADQLLATAIGDDVTVGRFGLVHACTLGNGVVVADGATVMDGAVVQAHSLIAPGAVVPPRKQLAGGFVYEGHPAKPTRPISRAELEAAAAAIRAGGALADFAPFDLPPSDLAPFVETASGSGPLYSRDGRGPSIGDAYVAPTAALIGDVVLGDGSGVFFGCVLDAGDARIVVGALTNVQDNTLLVTSRASGDLAIGDRVTLGHNVRMGSGRVDDDALIGMGSVVGDHVVVERGGCIGAGAWVEPGTVVRAGWIWAGRPARPFREVKPEERKEFARACDVYIRYGLDYREKR
jgi:carbonic anhydrase/acetyltransferase-like protein (isoleucine patch superfamily)